MHPVVVSDKIIGHADEQYHSLNGTTYKGFYPASGTRIPPCKILDIAHGGHFTATDDNDKIIIASRDIENFFDASD